MLLCHPFKYSTLWPSAHWFLSRTWESCVFLQAFPGLSWIVMVKSSSVQFFPNFTEPWTGPMVQSSYFAELWTEPLVLVHKGPVQGSAGFEPWTELIGYKKIKFYCFKIWTLLNTINIPDPSVPLLRCMACRRHDHYSYVFSFPLLPLFFPSWTMT